MRGEEKDRRYRAMKKSSFKAQKVKRTFWVGLAGWTRDEAEREYVIGVVLLEHPAATLVDLLVALAASPHGQGGIHVHVVAGQIERDEALENNAPPGKGRGEEDEEASGSAAVRDHVENSAKLGALVKISGREAV